jgi:hypothetical protein
MSVVFREFEFVVSTQSDAEPGRERTLVLAMEMVGKPGERRFYAELLALGVPQSPRDDIVQMEQAVLRLLKAVGVHVLVIDEVHNILARSHQDQRVVLNTLRFLSNRLRNTPMRSRP